MAANAANVQMGTCSVTVNGTDLGHTKGGVEVTYAPIYKDITVDMYGSTPVERKLTGEKWTAKVPFAEYTIANLNKIIADSNLAGAGNTRITLGSQSGKSGVTKAVTLLLHPLSAGNSKAYDIAFYKGHMGAPVQIDHKVDSEKILMVEFTAMIDETKADGNYLGLIGDSTT